MSRKKKRSGTRQSHPNQSQLQPEAGIEVAAAVPAPEVAAEAPPADEVIRPLPTPAPLPIAPADASPEAIGRHLRSARERLGIDLADAAGRLRLPWRVIAQLEAGEWDEMATPVYLRGYLRSYSRILDITPPELPQAEIAEPEVPPLVSTGGISHRRYLAQRYGAAATYLVITALIVAPMVLWFNGGLRDDQAQTAALDLPAATVTESKTVPAARPATPPEPRPLMASMAPINLAEVMHESGHVPAVSPALAPVAVPPSVLSVVLSEASWVEISNAAGERLEYALLEAGTHLYDDDDTLTVRLGNADAATVERGGRSLDLRPWQHANVAYFKVDREAHLHAAPRE